MASRFLSRLTPAGAALLSIGLLAACGSNGGNTNSGTDSTDGGYHPGSRITMVVPFSAGGGSDLSGRAIASGFEPITNTTITVENHEGGSGAIGYSDFLAMNGDPTKLLATETALIALPLAQDVQFSYQNFTPIFKAGDDFTLLTVRPDSPWQTCADVVAAARSESVVVAVSGATSLDEIVFSLIEADQNVKFDRIPYESGGEVLAGLLGGHVQAASLNPGEIIGQIQSGALKPLCALADQRYEYEELADIPTGIEQGINVSFAQFRGMIAPGGIPDEATEFWVNAATEYTKSEAYTQYIKDNFMQPTTLFGDEFKEYLTKYHDNMKRALES